MNGTPTFKSAHIDQVVSDWKNGGLPGEIVVDSIQAPHTAQCGDYPVWMAPQIKKALEKKGISRPYEHQATAWDRLRRAINVVIATPTASGKTLCYNVPVLQKLIENPGSTALYLFPTKALARDQEATIRQLAQLSEVDVVPVVYDGDTPSEVRRVAKQKSKLIITNPDMLHTGILPHHAAWASFLSGLSYVVVDELHQYRGVFGSHVSNVIRRLKRVAKFHGAAPTFAACSATIGNPCELAKNVIGDEFLLIDQSGAPTGIKRLVVYNPEEVDPVTGVRRSAQKVAARMTFELVNRGITSLVFCQTRRGVEMTLKYLQDRVKQGGGDPSRVRGYRGGYLPTLRREIETALREGKLDAVVATNALELGIDVGELDAVVLAGYPGTIAATFQRLGRAGRRQDPSLSVLIARSSPLDQFLVREPVFLTDSSPEIALVQPNNLDILLQHLKCAAFEVPFKETSRFGNLEVHETSATLDFLEQEGALSKNGGMYHYIAGSYPAADFSLRNVGDKRVVVMDKTTELPIAEMDPHSARLELYEQAIYQHDGQTFHVEQFDYENGKAFVREVPPVYYTVAEVQNALKVVEEHKKTTLKGGKVGFADVNVSSTVTGYKKVKFGNHENLGFGPVQLPVTSMETEGTWFQFNQLDFGPFRKFESADIKAGIEGLGNALHQIASLRLMCDVRDISLSVQATVDGDFDENVMTNPVLYIYDAHPGGVGLAQRAFEEATLLLDDTVKLVSSCPCGHGCPSCVGPGVKQGPPIKQLALLSVMALLGGDNWQ